MNRNIIFLIACLYSIQAFTQQRCGTDEYYQLRYAQNPALIQNRLDYEEVMQSYESVQNGRMISTVNIPVVVHLIGDDVIGAITYAKVQEQITILNDAYSGSNSIGVNIDVQFCLAIQDPFGQSTNGVVNITGGSFPATWDMAAPDTDTDSEMSLKTLSHWYPNNYLNIWVVNNLKVGSYDLYGIATFPEDLSSKPWKDGVVVIMGAFGTNSDPYSNLGLTAVHEVGHWLGLYHTFQRGALGGEVACLNDDCSINGDLICDTPPAEDGAESCITKNTCYTDSPDLDDPIENYMDWSPDACYTKFTSDQSIRINNTISTTRFALTQSAGCNTPSGGGSGGGGSGGGSGINCDNAWYFGESTGNCFTNLTHRGMNLNGTTTGVPVVTGMPIVLSPVRRCNDCPGWWEGDLSDQTVSVLSSSCNSDCHVLPPDIWNCSCFYENYFIEIVETDVNLNWIGTVHGDWITTQTPNLSWVFNHVDVDQNTVNLLNAPIINGKYYRIKLAFTFGGTWLEAARHFYYNGTSIYPQLPCYGTNINVTQNTVNSLFPYFYTNFLGASNSITTSGNILITGDKHWTAGNIIELNQEFEVQYGTEFSLEIYPCNSGARVFQSNDNNNLKDLQSSKGKPLKTSTAAKHSIQNDEVEKNNTQQSFNTTDSKFTIIPNPNNGLFDIFFDSVSVKQITILNSFNQPMQLASIETQSPIKIDLSSYAKGIYFLKIETNQGHIVYNKVVTK